jgi:hypothetical protein
LIRFSQWLLLLPLIVLFLFACGQLAILSSRYVPQAAIAASRSADYMPWRYLPFEQVRQGIVAEILKDRGASPDSLSGQLQGPAQGIQEAAAKATTTPTPEPTPADGSNPDPSATPGANQEPDPSASPTASPTPSPTGAPTNTPTATSTPTPAPSATATVTPSPEPMSSEGSTTTFWLSNTYNSMTFTYRLVPSQPTGERATAGFNASFASDRLGRSGTLRNEQVTAYLVVTNDRPDPVGVALNLVLDFEVVGTGVMFIPGSTTEPTLFSTTFTVSEKQIVSLSHFRLKIGLPLGVALYWDGSANESRIVLPLQFD